LAYFKNFSRKIYDKDRKKTASVFAETVFFDRLK